MRPLFDDTGRCISAEGDGSAFGGLTCAARSSCLDYAPFRLLVPLIRRRARPAVPLPLRGPGPPRWRQSDEPEGTPVLTSNTWPPFARGGGRCRLACRSLRRATDRRGDPGPSTADAELRARLAAAGPKAGRGLRPPTATTGGWSALYAKLLACCAEGACRQAARSPSRHPRPPARNTRTIPAPCRRSASRVTPSGALAGGGGGFAARQRPRPIRSAASAGAATAGASSPGAIGRIDRGIQACERAASAGGGAGTSAASTRPPPSARQAAMLARNGGQGRRVVSPGNICQLPRPRDSGLKPGGRWSAGEGVQHPRAGTSRSTLAPGRVRQHVEQRLAQPHRCRPGGESRAGRSAAARGPAPGKDGRIPLGRGGTLGPPPAAAGGRGGDGRGGSARPMPHHSPATAWPALARPRGEARGGARRGGSGGGSSSRLGSAGSCAASAASSTPRLMRGGTGTPAGTPQLFGVHLLHRPARLDRPAGTGRRRRGSAASPAGPGAPSRGGFSAVAGPRSSTTVSQGAAAGARIQPGLDRPVLHPLRWGCCLFRRQRRTPHPPGRAPARGSVRAPALREGSLQPPRQRAVVRQRQQPRSLVESTPAQPGSATRRPGARFSNTVGRPRGSANASPPA